MKSDSLLSQLGSSAAWINQRLGGAPFPTKSVVLGSGFKGFEERLTDAVSISFEEIPHMPRPKVAGHGSQLVVGKLGQERIVVLTGRVHLYEGLPEDQVVYAVRLLGHLGVTHILLTNASGSVDPKVPPKSIVLVKDHINFTGRNCLVGEEAKSLGPVFMDMGQTYDPAWRQAIKTSCSVTEGVYAGVLGPSYETPAETRMLGLMGAHIVGMSTIQEVLAARHLGIKVACLSLVTNMAGGLGHDLDHQDVIRLAKSQSESLHTLVAKSIGVAP